MFRNYYYAPITGKRKVKYSLIFTQCCTSWDIVQVLRRTGEYGFDKKYLEGNANFIAGGLTNTLFQMLKQDSGIDEECFIEIITRSLEKQ